MQSERCLTQSKLCETSSGKMKNGLLISLLKRDTFTLLDICRKDVIRGIVVETLTTWTRQKVSACPNCPKFAKEFTFSSVAFIYLSISARLLLLLLVFIHFSFQTNDIKILICLFCILGLSIIVHWWSIHPRRFCRQINIGHFCTSPQHILQNKHKHCCC